MKILGIDPGLAATGIGIVDGERLTARQFAHGVIKTHQNDSLPHRLEFIYNRVEIIIKSERPDLIIIEDIFSLDRFPRSGIVLGKVSGVIILACQQAGIEVSEIPVREAKKVLTGNGGATKEQLEKAVRKALQHTSPIRPFHASDALGLALLGLFRYGATDRSSRRS